MEIEYYKADTTINRNILKEIYDTNDVKSIYQHPDYIENNYPASFLFILKEKNITKSYCFVSEFSLSKLKFIKHCKIKYGAIGKEKYSDILNSEIIKYYKKNKYTSINYIPFENTIYEKIKNENVLVSSRETGTLIIDLSQDLENITHSYSTNLKRNLKKAEKLGLIIKELDSENEFNDLNLVYNRLFNHRKINLSNKNFTLDIIHFLQKHKLGFTIGCYENEILIGGAVLLENNNRIEYFIGASNPEYRHLPILHAVFQYAIMQSKQNGYPYFDLGGIVFTKEDEQLNNITSFKYQFSKDIIKYNPDFELILSKKRKWIHNNYLNLSKNNK
jgi:lipid II:glycine glycyltransferase (peptidoglycan interpeptide bridge formation enzyme)